MVSLISQNFNEKSRERHIFCQILIFQQIKFPILDLGQFSSDFDDFYIKKIRSSSLRDFVSCFKILSGHSQVENAAETYSSVLSNQKKKEGFIAQRTSTDENSSYSHPPHQNQHHRVIGFSNSGLLIIH